MDLQTGTRDLWVFDLKRGGSSRLTFDPADDLNPVWTHDGSRIFFTSDRKGQRDIYAKPANGIGTETSVSASKQPKAIDDLSPDRRYVVAGNRGYNYVRVMDRETLAEVYHTQLPTRNGLHLGMHHSEMVAGATG